MICSVLVVEDHADTGESYVRVFRKLGLAAHLAGSRAEAERYLAVTAPDVVLLDYHLGDGTDGLDVLRALRERPAWRGIPVVMMSASILPERVLAEARELGARGWIDKGTSQLGDLVGTVRRICAELDHPSRN